MKVVAVLRTVQGPRHNALMPHWKLKKNDNDNRHGHGQDNKIYRKSVKINH